MQLEDTPEFQEWHRGFLQEGRLLAALLRSKLKARGRTQMINPEDDDIWAWYTDAQEALTQRKHMAYIDVLKKTGFY